MSKSPLFFCVVFLLPISIQAQVLTTFTLLDGLLDNNVHSICRGTGEDLWLGTQSGVAHFDAGSFLTPITVEDGLVHETVFAVLCDASGDIWMGTDFGLSRFDGTTCVTYTTDNGLEDNRVKHLFEDTSGGIWIAHNDGVSVFDGADFTHYTTADGLPFGGVNHIAQDGAGNMWFGTGLGGAFALVDGELTGYTADAGLPNNSVRSIALDQGGRKWIGTNEGIVVFGDDNTAEETHLSLIALPPPHEINPVEDIVIDGTGRAWVGVYVDYLVSVGGVAYFDGNDWVDFDVDDGLAGPNVRGLAVAANGDVWVATSTGVTRFSGTPAQAITLTAGGVEVYPNPATNQFFVEGTEGHVAATMDCTLRDAMGRVVGVERAAGSRLIWDVTHLAGGVYFLSIASGQELHTRRVWIRGGE